MLSAAGRSLLDRRSFLADVAGGPSAFALLHLLAEARGAERSPVRPAIDRATPLAAREPHFAPKAKRILHVFCSGACSHLDTFDYKPELIKHDGKPMPGSKLVTFQGENGNLTKSPYAFRPR